jgi:hypothetical protein
MNLFFNQRIRFRFICLFKLDYDELIYGIEPCDVRIGVFSHMSGSIKVVEKTWSVSSRFSRMPLLLGYVFFSSNIMEIFLVPPANDSHQQKVAHSFADSVAFAQKSEL